MIPRLSNRAKTVLFGCGLSAFMGCASRAIVFINPNYITQHVSQVTVLAFADFPGQQGSGAIVTDIFEKYLFNLKYNVVDPTQAQQALNTQPANSTGLDAQALAALGKTLNVDAVVTGTVSEMTNASEQTVMVDMPQEDTEPVYQQTVVQGRHGQVRTVTQQTGVQTVYSDQTVPETETLPARVGLSVRLVSTKNGELLWSGSGTADGLDISNAAEVAAAKIIQALQKKLANG